MSKSKFCAVLTAAAMLAAMPAYADSISPTGVKIDTAYNRNTEQLQNLIISADIMCGEDADLLTAYYRGGRLTSVKSILDKNDTTDRKLAVTEIGSGGKSVTLRLHYEQTPDEIKLFLVKKGSIVPLCQSKSLLDEEAISAANESVIAILKPGVDELIEKRSEFTAKEKKIIDKIADCAENAMLLKNQYLLTTEFIYEYFESDMREAKQMYDELADQSGFYSKVITGAENVNNLIDYLRIRTYFDI